MTEGTKRKVLNISLPPALYREVERLAKEQAKAKGEFAREVLRQYVETDKRWKQIREWGTESAERLKARSTSQVEELIEQYRKEQSV
jgi:metal-responsive CopG/Arc/MetJ family transcriptional regulator